MIKHSHTYYLLILLILTLTNQGLKATNAEPRQFDKSSWKEIVRDADYTEHFKESKPKKPKKPKTEQALQSENNLLSGSVPAIAKVLLYILIIGILAFLIFLILKKGFKSFGEKVPEQKLATIIQNLEDNLHRTDFDDLLEQAINQGEFRLAVRIFYLRVIKQLSDKGRIKWKREKTNGQYVREMSDKTEGLQFALLTTIYEQVWFGDYGVSPEKFGLIKVHFNKFLEELK